MTSRVCLVHYHEIGLKGKNRSTFERQLITNLKRALKGRSAHVERLAGYVRVHFEDEDVPADVPELISRVPGVARVSVAYRCEREPEQYNEAAIESLKACEPFQTFKVHGRRSNTDYPIHSIDLNRQVGAVLCDAFPDKKVQMHQPDVTVNVHVVQSDVYVYADAASMRGAGGLPVGTAGKVVTLLSSGFDSPVATWMVGRRGAACVPVHFSGRPMTSDASEWLTQDIVRALEPAGIIGRLYVVPFGECQREISLKAPQSLRVIMYRRLMFEVAQAVASRGQRRSSLVSRSDRWPPRRSITLRQPTTLPRFRCFARSSALTRSRSSIAPAGSGRMTSALRPLRTAARCSCRAARRRTRIWMPFVVLGRPSTMTPW